MTGTEGEAEVEIEMKATTHIEAAEDKGNEEAGVEAQSIENGIRSTEDSDLDHDKEITLLTSNTEETTTEDDTDTQNPPDPDRPRTHTNANEIEIEDTTEEEVIN